MCKKCNNDKGATADGHQLDESRHDAADHISPNLGGNLDLPPIVADAEVIIEQLEKELKQHEDAKSAVESKQQHFKRITKSKLQIFQKLDEVSRLLSKQKSDDLSSSTNQNSYYTVMTHKRNTLIAEREAQWVTREESLLEEFNEKRKHELTEIEVGWTEKWKRETEDKWSAIELYLKEDQPEKDLDSRRKQFINKSMSESQLKLEGIKILWEMRNNIEWTAHRLTSKSQWDSETGQLWTEEEQKCMTKHADEVASKADTAISTDSKQINEILEDCKSRIENIFKSSKAMVKITEKILQTIEQFKSKEVEGCQELHNIMAVISRTIRRQEEELKTMRKKNKELEKKFTNVRKEKENSTELNKNEEDALGKCYLAENLAEKQGRKSHKNSATMVAEKYGNKQTIENYHENAAKSWKCKACTLDNPHNKYICDTCSMCDAEQKERVILENDEVEKQKNWPRKSNEDLLNAFEQNHTEDKLVPKNKRWELNDEELHFGQYIDGEDPFELLDNSGKTGDQHRENVKNKQLIGQQGKNDNENSKKQSNKINQKEISYHWTCEHCTMDNPFDQHICEVCGIPNTVLEIAFDHEKAAAEKQNNQTIKNNEDNSTENDGNLQRITKFDDSTREPIEVNQEEIKVWSCEYCTTDNPLNQYICETCSKTNAERRADIGHEKGAVQKRKQPTLKLNKYINIAENELDSDNSLDRPQSILQRAVNYFSNPSNYFVICETEREPRKIMAMLMIPWESQNGEIKKNYRKIVASERMDGERQGAETAAILQYIYPEVNIDIIVDSLLQYKDIGKTINTISKHLKKN